MQQREPEGRKVHRSLQQSTHQGKITDNIFMFKQNLNQEPKLSAARRIVTEWTDYDEEMARLGEQIAEMK